MILFNNAKIYTVDGAGWETRPATEMLVGDDGRILRVGGRAATSRPYNPSEGCCLDAAGGRGRPP
ncbi:MAG: hypothetical protein LBR00_03705, partial [Clostridiales Family XIII bacterium]|nr:hypothetical protein [Clostridiales Family XIII bacterium]